MDKFQALHSFWSSFGIPAYDENTVPSGNFTPETPYITYEAAVSDLGHPIALSASLWYYGPSWRPVTEKALEIESEIGRGGVTQPMDNGALWIKRGNPFARRMSDPNDMIRRIIVNIEAEYFTA